MSSRRAKKTHVIGCKIDSYIQQAGMAELADAADSKSAEGNLIGVRPPVPAPTK
jgi:hypothetical protein